MNKVIDQCPVCMNELIVTELFCANCATSISGHFETLSTPLNRLNSDQLDFILTFIRCEGKFNHMEEELKLSYPTLKNRFSEILSVMGYDSKNELQENRMHKENRLEILRELEEGTISPDEAEIKLRRSIKKE